jgi:hypothetical protein
MSMCGPRATSSWKTHVILPTLRRMCLSIASISGGSANMRGSSGLDGAGAILRRGVTGCKASGAPAART